jgi:16S rRNA processing protein RimM
VERAALPPPEPEEFYFADLIGLRAETAEGRVLGIVRAVEDHDAGAFLVIDGPPELLLPFTRATVPVVDVAGGRVVCDLPDEIIVQPQPGDEEATA